MEFFKDGEAVYWSLFLEYETVLEETGRETSGLTQAGKLCYEKLRAIKEELAAKHMGYLLLRAREGEDEFVTIKCIACDNMKIWKTLL